MKRSVLVYRAEAGAQNVFGAGVRATPAERQTIDRFTINEPDVDKARQVAIAFVLKRHHERPSGVSILASGAISVTLPARA